MALLALGGGLGGCSTRRVLTIDSDPPGARAWIDGREAGRTPVQVPFAHPGRFDVRLEKEGFAALATEVWVPSAFSDYPIVDLPHELTIRERRWRWTARLEPLAGDPSEAEMEEILRRARAFRDRTREETSTDLPPRLSR